ncbi:MAG: prepilin peptidase [Patescibacteria group bacterium]
MTLVLYLASGVLGLIVGSFLNVLIIRVPNAETIRGRSQCRTCRKTLRWHELIPVLSFALQKGRCRSCGAVLSLQYPLVESGTALAFTVATFFLIQSCGGTPMPAIEGNPLLFCSSSFSFILTLTGIFAATAAAIVIIVVDLRDYIIPDGAVLILLAAGIMRIVLSVIGPFAPSSLSIIIPELAAASGAALFLGSIWFFSRGRAMGFGDIKLVFSTSLIAGFPLAIAALIFSFWLGGIAGLALLVLGRKNLKSKIPFGPFIILGAVAALAFAPQIQQIWGW